MATIILHDVITPDGRQEQLTFLAKLASNL